MIVTNFKQVTLGDNAFAILNESFMFTHNQQILRVGLQNVLLSLDGQWNYTLFYDVKDNPAAGRIEFDDNNTLWISGFTLNKADNTLYENRQLIKTFTDDELEAFKLFCMGLKGDSVLAIALTNGTKINLTNDTLLISIYGYDTLSFTGDEIDLFFSGLTVALSEYLTITFENDGIKCNDRTLIKLEKEEYEGVMEYAKSYKNNS